MYTGGLAFYVGMAEKRVDIGYWDGVYFLMFVWAIMKKKRENNPRIISSSSK
jgi:hypothetical protein